MREVLPELLPWWEAGETVGVGTVVATFQSAPRPPGAAMLVGPGGEAVGSVSGGCVEGAVYELGQRVIADGSRCSSATGSATRRLRGRPDLRRHPGRVRRDGRPRDLPGARRRRADLEAGRPVAIATVVEHPDAVRIGAAARRPPGGPCHRCRARSGSARADDAVADDARGLLAAGRNQTLNYGPDGERRGEGMRVFVWSFAPKPRMLVFGAIDFAAAVARVGSFLGYHVTVCDARPVFATATRFPGPTRWSSSGRTSTSEPRSRRAASTAHGHLRAHPRPQVRRPAARGGPAHARRSPTSGRWGRGAPTTTA